MGTYYDQLGALEWHMADDKGDWKVCVALEELIVEWEDIPAQVAGLPGLRLLGVDAQPTHRCRSLVLDLVDHLVQPLPHRLLVDGR